MDIRKSSKSQSLLINDTFWTASKDPEKSTIGSWTKAYGLKFISAVCYRIVVTGCLLAINLYPTTAHILVHKALDYLSLRSA